MQRLLQQPGWMCILLCEACEEWEFTQKYVVFAIQRRYQRRPRWFRARCVPLDIGFVAYSSQGSWHYPEQMYLLCQERTRTVSLLQSTPSCNFEGAPPESHKRRCIPFERYTAMGYRQSKATPNKSPAGANSPAMFPLAKTNKRERLLDRVPSHDALTCSPTESNQTDRLSACQDLA